MQARHSHWTEGKIWQHRGYQARVSRDGSAVELRKADGSVSMRFPPTTTHEDLVDFIVKTESDPSGPKGTKR
jgi:hypothetical protein